LPGGGAQRELGPTAAPENVGRALAATSIIDFFLGGTAGRALLLSLGAELGVCPYENIENYTWDTRTYFKTPNTPS